MARAMSHMCHEYQTSKGTSDMIQMCDMTRMCNMTHMSDVTHMCDVIFDVRHDSHV